MITMPVRTAVLLVLNALLMLALSKTVSSTLNFVIGVTTCGANLFAKCSVIDPFHEGTSRLKPLLQCTISNMLMCSCPVRFVFV